MGDSAATIILFSTVGCHLCEEAGVLVEDELDSGGNAGRWQLLTRDIADDEALMERYGIRIPVVQRTDSGEELSWPFDRRSLAVFLAGR